MFDGTVEQLYRTKIEPMAPDPKLVARFHRWLSKYCAEDAPVFPVRQVKGAERRQTYQTCDGTHIAPADNSPAWAVHAALMHDRLSSYTQFREHLLGMPTHVFDIKQKVGPTSQGYYFAHLLPAKNGDTKFRSWRRSEVERRCYLTLHPCNFFLVPCGRTLGEDQRVIRFVASMYRNRYGATWVGFLKRVGESDASFGRADPTDVVHCPREVESGVVRYRYGRLCFKRDIIEPLAWNRPFEVITPFGSYRFTKRQFHAAFPSIPKTRSYRELGLYHVPKLHLRAGRFRLPDLG